MGRRADLLGRLEKLNAASPDPLVAELLARGDLLRARIDAVKDLKVHAAKTRCHGDYHLGQVLAAQNEFMIIDFEGEPKRGFAERRRKHTPVRDVAGMVRSIDYAAGAAMRAAADLPSTDRPDFEALCRDWRDRSTAAFLDGYHANITGIASWPEDRSEVAGLFELMLLEKVLYEIGYELANRPVWLPIPIQGLIDLLDREEGRATDGLSQ